jgi:hypothetical protein
MISLWYFYGDGFILQSTEIFREKLHLQGSFFDNLFVNKALCQDKYCYFHKNPFHGTTER